MHSPLHLLIIDDSPDDAELLTLAVRRGGYDPEWKRVDTAETLMAALLEKVWDVAIADYNMPNFDGIAAVELVGRYANDTPVILVSGCMDDRVGTTAMNNGACDYLMKNNLSRLIPVLRRELSQAQQQRRQVSLEVERKRLEAAMHEAQSIQQTLLPIVNPHVEGFDIAGAAFPADVTGGDYFDFFSVDRTKLGIAIGDASGHGIGPALVMAQTRTCLRALTLESSDIPQILFDTNQVLFQGTPSEYFMTLLLAYLDTTTQSLVYGSGGHDGLIIDQTGCVKTYLESTGIPLGIAFDADFPCATPVPLSLGDVVLFMTDGIPEARSPDGELFGQQRAVSIVQQYRDFSASEIVTNLYHAVRAFTHIKPQRDDITAIVIKVNCLC